MAVACDSRAEDGHHILWTIQGKHNTVYLLGSMHLLRPADSALPAEVLQDYASAQKLVMELDLSAEDPPKLLGPDPALADLPADETLPKVLGRKLYAQLKAHADRLGLDLKGVQHFQPWLVVLILDQLELAKLGFDADSGVDMQLLRRAQADHKPVIGLETTDEQYGLFAHLSIKQQRQYLRSALQDEEDNPNETDELFQAWQRGDAAALEKLLQQGANEAPEIYRLLTVDRNRKWLPKIAQLLNDDTDYLVVVGALHLVGRFGLIDLLQSEGFSVIQQ
ncbi:MAG TPA: TraB/GumN family protein [Steroidobacteraceae bacterium]